MPILNNEKKALKELKKLVSQYHNLLEFKIFGSKARGSDSKDSDIDIMIVIDDISPIVESQIDDLIFEINLNYDCFITPLYFSQQELSVGSLAESPKSTGHIMPCFIRL